ncbi:MAG: hypothetical protein GY754_37665 [bacterium]|nr:hypothetical protein [bacterium]
MKLNNNHILKIFFILFILVVSFPVVALEPVIIDKAIDSRSIGPIGKNIEYIEDTGNSLSINDVVGKTFLWKRFNSLDYENKVKNEGDLYYIIPAGYEI